MDVVRSISLDNQLFLNERSQGIYGLEAVDAQGGFDLCEAGSGVMPLQIVVNRFFNRDFTNGLALPSNWGGGECWLNDPKSCCRAIVVEIRLLKRVRSRRRWGFYIELSV